MADKPNVQIGPSSMTCLTIVFVILKALGYIEWSWVWVLSPLWIGIAVVVLILAVLSGFALLATLIEALRR